jgi:Ran GTPase-activating protein (RanGAP) involved in mRNA processing and transport
MRRRLLLGLHDSYDSNSDYASAEEESEEQAAGVMVTEGDDFEEEDEENDEEARDEGIWEILERKGTARGFFTRFSRTKGIRI